MKYSVNFRFKSYVFMVKLCDFFWNSWKIAKNWLISCFPLSNHSLMVMEDLDVAQYL